MPQPASVLAVGYHLFRALLLPELLPIRSSRDDGAVGRTSVYLYRNCKLLAWAQIALGKSVVKSTMVFWYSARSRPPPYSRQKLLDFHTASPPFLVITKYFTDAGATLT